MQQLHRKLTGKMQRPCLVQSYQYLRANGRKLSHTSYWSNRAEASCSENRRHAAGQNEQDQGENDESGRLRVLTDPASDSSKGAKNTRTETKNCAAQATHGGGPDIAE